jgi:hypothetical protein
MLRSKGWIIKVTEVRGDKGVVQVLCYVGEKSVLTDNREASYRWNHKSDAEMNTGRWTSKGAKVEVEQYP